MNAERLLANYERIADTPDAITRLRRFVFDLAVRGKLAPQDARDAPVELKLLQRELENRKQPTGRTGADLGPVTFDEVPVAIPSSWQWSRLFQLCVRDAPIVYGILQPGPDVRPEGVPYIRPSEIENGRINLSAIRHTTQQIANQYSRAAIQTGDLIFTIVGTIGAVAIVPETLDGGNITQSSCRLRVDPRLIEREFLAHVLLSGCVIDQINRMRLGTAVPRLNIAHVRAIAVPLPPLAEQRRIVAKIGELMTLCDRLEATRAEREATRDRLTAASLARLNTSDADTFHDDARFALDALPALTARADQIKLLRQTILNLAVRGKLVPQDASDEPASELLKRIATEKARIVNAGKIKSDPKSKLTAAPIALFDLPIGWALAELQSVCISITDGDHLPPPKAETGVPFLVISDIRSKRINYSPERHVPRNYYEALDAIRRPRLGDLLYTLVGSFGIPVEIVDDREFCVQRHIGILRPSTSIAAAFLARIMESEFVFQQAAACATGIAQKTVPLSGLRKIAIPLPPIAEQHRILAKVNELMALCDRLEAGLISAADVRRRLLDALLAEALTPDDARELEAAE